jgi:Skp family chaperone for outer membrane proteins
MRILLLTLAVLLVCVFGAEAQTQQCSQKFVDACDLAARKLGQTEKALKSSEEAKLEAEKRHKAERELDALKIQFLEMRLKASQDRVKQLVEIKCQETEVAFKPLGFTIFRWKKKRCFE